MVFSAITVLCYGSDVIDGITYELDSVAKTATVVSGEYHGDILVIPDSVVDSSGNVYLVTAIGIGAMGSYRATSVTLPASLNTIGVAAFSGCDSLKGISIPEGVTSIPEDAFNMCESLSYVKLPSTLLSIGEYAFFKCSSLERISIPEGITNIPMCAFFGCDSLSSVKLPSTLLSIGLCAFEGCI